jgi:hypothetical protein
VNARDGGTIDGDEARFGVRTLAVNGASDQFLAGPAFPREQHRRAGRRHLANEIEHALHRQASTHDRVRIVLSIQFAAQILVLLIQFAVAHHAANFGQHFVEYDRLHEIVVGAALKRFDRILDGRISGHERDQCLRADLEQTVEQFNAVEPGQLHIADGDIEPFLRRQFEAGFGGRGGFDRVRFLCQELGQCAADQRFVIDDEDSARRRCGTGRHAFCPMFLLACNYLEGILQVVSDRWTLQGTSGVTVWLHFP